MVLGSSYGGMVALSYAVRYPQNISHLIVIATVADSRFLTRAKEILAERGTEEQKLVQPGRSKPAATKGVITGVNLE